MKPYLRKHRLVPTLLLLISCLTGCGAKSEAPGKQTVEEVSSSTEQSKPETQPAPDEVVRIANEAIKTKDWHTYAEQLIPERRTRDFEEMFRIEIGFHGLELSANARGNALESYGQLKPRFAAMLKKHGFTEAFLREAASLPYKESVQATKKRFEAADDPSQLYAEMKTIYAQFPPAYERIDPAIINGDTAVVKAKVRDPRMVIEHNIKMRKTDAGWKIDLR